MSQCWRTSKQREKITSTSSQATEENRWWERGDVPEMSGIDWYGGHIYIDIQALHFLRRWYQRDLSSLGWSGSSVFLHYSEQIWGEMPLLCVNTPCSVWLVGRLLIMGSKLRKVRKVFFLSKLTSSSEWFFYFFPSMFRCGMFSVGFLLLL